jgi:cell division protein FtsB
LRSLLPKLAPPPDPDVAATPAPVRISKVRRRAHPRRRLVALLVALALVVGIGVGGAFAYESVKHQTSQLQAQLTMHLQLGQADLQAAKDSLKLANTNHDIKLVNKAEVEFISAKTQFLTTRQIADGSQLLGQVERAPVVGTQARSLHSSLDGVAAMGAALSDAGIDLSGLAGELIAPPSGGQAGHTLLTVLGQADTTLAKVRADLERADVAAGGVDVGVIPAGQQATFVKARASIASALLAMDQFQQLVPIISEAMGANGPRNYLIEQVNPAELRPGGGFIGSYSLMQANQGALKLLQSGDAYTITDPRPMLGQKGYVAPPDPLRDLVPTTSWSFVDSNFFPDFPSNATAAETFAAPRLGTSLDAVIAIDYYSVAKLLEVTGPIQVPGYGVTVDSGNFVSTVIQGDLLQGSNHKAILAAAAGPLMQIIASLPPERWPALLSALNDLAGSHHLQVYFNNPKLESTMDQFGWSGRVNPSASYDFMSEVEANLGATKANYFITRHYTVVLTRQGKLLHHQVIVDLTDDMPYSYRPNEYYRAYLRLFVPANASGAVDDLTALKWVDPAPPQGTRQLAGWVSFHGYGHSIRRTFQYDTPWPSDARGNYDIYWQKQPGTAGDGIDVSWNPGTGRTYSASGALNLDLLVKLSPAGVSFAAAQTATAKIPSLSLGS